VPISEVGSSYFQETNLKAIFEDICVYNEYISDPKQMPRIAQQAVQTALTEGGVAHLSVPSDVINLDVLNSDLGRDILIPKATIMPCPAELQKAASALNRGGKIAILAGDGCRNARDELVELSTKLNAPIIRTLRARWISWPDSLRSSRDPGSTLLDSTGCSPRTSNTGPGSCRGKRGAGWVATSRWHP
jgi:pyruvate dehydrogenase (quinone)